MRKKTSLQIIFSLLTGLHLLGCASTTERGEVDAGRSQLMLVPSSQIEEQATAAYEQTKAEAAKSGTLDRDLQTTRRLQTIAKRLIPHTGTFRKEATQWSWEVHLIDSRELNAYCMPGGKIMFYSSLIQELNLTDAEIAAVMGHEIAHALREHGRERMSEEILKQGALMALVASGKVDEKYVAALSALSTVFISLPHSRNQESEGDKIGLELMARAGYNPSEAVTLWRKMGSHGGGKPPEILSTHPSDETRIQNIEKLLPKVMPLYQATQSSSQKRY